ncbi:MAG: cell division protein FtsA [Alphaproteobacteria bacterium]|nr:cell division protein FtsA [Alphaproteobacteria bacterium]
MSHSFNKSPIVAALDIGTSKVCCVIAKVTRDKRVSILGYGYNASKGIKNGAVVDVNEATIAVCNAVETAEQMANERITNVIVNVSGDRTRSVIRSSNISIHKNRPVMEEDVKKVTDKGLMKVNVEGNEPIHFLTMGYHVDCGEEVKNPINIFGENLSVDILLGLYPRPMYKNLTTVVESSHLEVDMKAFSAYASGLSCLVDDERELGSSIIDIGGGTTSIASFRNGHPVYFGSIPVGGINVTNDIALGLTTSFNYAEEIKNRHGCAFLIGPDEKDIINVYPVGEEDDSNIKQIYKSDLINIIAPRIEEIFELVGRKLDEAGYKNSTSHRVVLTGGAAQLPGMREVASLVLDKQVRIGRPRNIENIPAELHNPVFSTALGLLLFAVNNSERKIVKKVNVSSNTDGVFAKILELFKKTC